MMLDRKPAALNQARCITAVVFSQSKMKMQLSDKINDKNYTMIKSYGPKLFIVFKLTTKCCEKFTRLKMVSFKFVKLCKSFCAESCPSVIKIFLIGKIRDCLAWISATPNSFLALLTARKTDFDLLTAGTEESSTSFCSQHSRMQLSVFATSKSFFHSATHFDKFEEIACNYLEHHHTGLTLLSKLQCCSVFWQHHDLLSH